MTAAAPLWRVALTVPLRVLETYEAALTECALALSSFLADPDDDERDEDVLWTLEAFSEDEPDRALLEESIRLVALVLDEEAPPLIVEQMPDCDWVAENRQAFPPIDAGRFFVHSSFFEGQLPSGRISMLIDAGTAFGSGEHATTWGCLTAIDRLCRQRRFRAPLDLGTGTGILALGIAKLLNIKVAATDIDPEAVTVARRNAMRNGAAALLRPVVSEGYRRRQVRAGRPYDLIVANVLANPLCDMAADLSRHLASDGVAVLSGLLVRQEQQVINAHRAQGLSLAARIRKGDWSTLILTRSARTIALR